MTNLQAKSLIILSNNGDKKARQALFTGFENLAAKIAKTPNFMNQGLTKDDLIQAALEGLALAIKNVDESKLTSFYAYAYSCIENNIKSELCRCNVNAFSFSVREKKLLRKMVALVVEETEKSNFTSQDSIIYEASQETGLDYQLCKDYFAGMHLDQFNLVPSDNGNFTSEENFIPSKYSTENEVFENELKSQVNKIVLSLSPKHADFIIRSYGLMGHKKETITEISRQYNKTKAWGSYMLKCAKQQFKTAALAAHLNDF